MPPIMADEKRGVRCFVRKLDPVEHECYSTVAPPLEFGELSGVVNFVGHGKIFSKWNLNPECKTALTNQNFGMLLAYYHPNLSTIVTANASKYGIGAVVYYVSTDGPCKSVDHDFRTQTLNEGI
nr:hypothetical transcript [Hymenolepis microstoma]